MFPVTRPRRLRRTASLRSLVRQTSLDAGDFVYPLFVRSGEGVRQEIRSMPGNFHFSIDTLVEEVGQAWREGIRSVLLFGIFIEFKCLFIRFSRIKHRIKQGI